MTLEEKYKQLLEFVQELYYSRSWVDDTAAQVLINIGELEADD